jgi:hypothetical protein
MRNVIPGIIVVTLTGVWTGSARALPRTDNQATDHRSHIFARVVTQTGTERPITIEGVGCWQSLCSRVAIRGRAEAESRVTTTWLDAIAAIQDITPNDAAVVLKDGTVRRLAIVQDNRVIYFRDQLGREGKLDLTGVTSVQFVAR